MPEMQWTFDGTPVTDPINWQDTELSLDRDELGAIIYSAPSEFIFWKEAYAALNNLFIDSVCSEVAIVLNYDEDGTGFTTVIDGVSNPGLIQFDLDNLRARTQVLEENYQELIQKNRDIKVFIGVGRSKNDVSYTGATKQTIDLFDPNAVSGSYAATNVESYTVEAALEDIISFMTDDQIGMTNNVTEFATLCICTGDAINNFGGAGNFKPGISFDDLIGDLRKLYNIGYYIDTAGPNLVIDYYDQVFDPTNNVTINETFKVTRLIDQQKLYTRVDIGSADTQSFEDGAFTWPDIRYLSHKSEQYHLENNCNTGTVLDLVVKNLIIDNNVFEAQVINAIAATPLFEFENNVFLFEANGGLTQAVKFDLFNLGAAPFEYNFNLTNQERVPRFVGVIPNNLLVFLGDGNDYFEATKTVNTPDTAPTTTLARVDYNNVVSDPNANYDNTAGQYHYTAPVAGFYRFNASIDVSNLSIPSVLVEIALERRPSGGGAAIETKTKFETLLVSSTVLFEPTGFFMNALEEMNVFVEVTDIGGLPFSTYDLDGGTFECIEAATGGGNYASFDPNDTNLLIYEADFPMSYIDFKSIRDAPNEAITINLPDGTTKKGWAQQLGYNLNSGRTSLKMVTNKNL